MSFNLVDKVFQCLSENQDVKFTSRQIAEWIGEHHPQDCQTKMERSNNKSITDFQNIIGQIDREIYARYKRLIRQHPEIKMTEGRPRQFYFTQKSDEQEVHEVEQNPESNTILNENDLYPILADYLYTEYGLYSKRIDEKKSKNNRGSNGNKWLYPDVVAMEDLTLDWDREIKDCVKQYKDSITKLWSFEVKILLNSSNVREAFFQAVSNSSWAKFGAQFD